MQKYNSTMARGIDISNAQGEVNFNDVVKAGNSFVFIKATEGATFIDPKFNTNYANAKKAGLLRGAYCFARPLTSNPQQEVTAFVNLVKRKGGFELPGALDLEDVVAGEKLGKAVITSYAHEWLNLCDKQSGKTTVLYTNVNFFNTYLDDSFKNRSLWVADYGVAAPPNVCGIDTWTFFQYTDEKWDGQETTDSNYFNGTLEELREFAGLVDVQSSSAGACPQLEIGSRGSAVKEVQKLVGADPIDGIFGPETKGKVDAFQRRHHLIVDGVVGPHTCAALSPNDKLRGTRR